LRILKLVYKAHKSKVDIRVFGCSAEELDGLEEAKGFEFVNLGVLQRREVAMLFKGADVFLDASHFQAFGCAGLEAMACGCAAVVPRNGGSKAYVTDGRNGFLIDSQDCAGAVHVLESLILDREYLATVKAEAAKVGKLFSVPKSAYGILQLMAGL
jgi:glycosyltransferase involved in cell wall biosynthesis